MLPVTLVNRSGYDSRIPESYILDSKAREKYVAGQSVRGSLYFKDNVAMLYHKVKHGEITSRREARAWLQDDVEYSEVF